VISVIPTFIGEGIPLIAPSRRTVPLELISSTQVSGWRGAVALCAGEVKMVIEADYGGEFVAVQRCAAAGRCRMRLTHSARRMPGRCSSATLSGLKRAERWNGEERDWIRGDGRGYGLRHRRLISGREGCDNARSITRYVDGSDTSATGRLGVCW